MQPAAPPSNGIGPGASWNGTAGSGGTAPAEDPTLRGSGSVQKAIGNFDEPTPPAAVGSSGYLTADMALTVLCDHHHDAWIQEVEFWVEGSTVTIPVSTQTLSGRTGAIGYACTLNFSLFPRDGDFQVYAYIRPVNGYERRIGPLTLTVIGTGVSTITRPVRYLDFTNGNDTWDGTSPTFVSGTIGPKKTVNAALRLAPDGAIVKMAAGTYLEDLTTNTPVNNPARPITFQRADGLLLGDVVISKTTRGDWNLYCAKVIFDGLQFNTDQFHRVSGRPAPSFYRWESCNIVSPGGPSGPSPSGIAWSDVSTAQTYLNQSLSGAVNKAYHALVDCTFTNPPTTGWIFARGTTFSTGWDAVFLDNGSSNTVCLNCTAIKKSALIQRTHDTPTVTVSAVSFDGVNNRTTITWASSPSLQQFAAGQTDTSLRCRFQTGALANTSAELHVQGYQVYSEDDATDTTVLYGNVAPAVGDTAVVAVLAHSDSMQLGILGTADVPVENVIFQRYLAKSDPADDPTTGGFQPQFFQAGNYTGAGTITTVGTALTSTLAHGLVKGDYVAVGTGTAGQSRRVVSVDSSTTATLASAFSPDQSAAAWRQVKTLKDVAVQLCIFDTIRTTLDNNAQWQHAQQHYVGRQCLLHSGDWQMRTDQGNFSAESSVFKDSIIRSMVTTAFPTDLALDNNHFEVTPTRGTNASSGAITLDTTYKPTAGVTRTIAAPKLKFDFYGNPLHMDGTDLVGAVKAP